MKPLNLGNRYKYRTILITKGPQALQRHLYVTQQKNWQLKDRSLPLVSRDNEKPVEVENDFIWEMIRILKIDTLNSKS